MAADPLPDGSQIPTQTALGADIAATTPPLRQWADRSVSATAGGRAAITAAARWWACYRPKSLAAGKKTIQITPEAPPPASAASAEGGSSPRLRLR